MGNAPLSVLLANLADIYLAGISNLLLKVDRSPFQILDSTPLDNLVQRVRELRPHLLLVGLPRKGVDVEGTIVEIRELFPEVMIAVFAIPDVKEYREALAIAKRAGVDVGLSLEVEDTELVRSLKQLFVQRAEAYKQRLRDLPVGDGRGYELFAEEVLPFLFKPHFSRFRSQVRQGDGDQFGFVCRNEGQHSFCKTILRDHRATYVVFEAKNEAKPTEPHLEQLAAFLTPATGGFGTLLVRQPPKPPQELYKHLGSRFLVDEKMIIVLYDDDVLEMLDMRIRLCDPMDYLEERYDHYRRMHVARSVQEFTETFEQKSFKAKATAQIFLSYAREDEEKVEELYQELSNAVFKPWIDTKDIMPGEIWRYSITKAIRRSDFFLACLSANSVNKRGFLQKEIREALNTWQEMLDSDIYLIPVRLEDCEIPERLRDFQWVNLFEKDGWARLLKAIQAGMERRRGKS